MFWVKKEGVPLHSAQILDGFSAERAETEPGLQPFTAIGTVGTPPPFLMPVPYLPRFIGQAATALALQKWGSFFYPDKGQEKYGEVVIHPPICGLH